MLVFDTSAAADAAADKHTPCRPTKPKKKVIKSRAKRRPPLNRLAIRRLVAAVFFDCTFLFIVFVPVAAAGSPFASAAFSFCPKVFSGKYPAKRQFSWLTYGGRFVERQKTFAKYPNEKRFSPFISEGHCGKQKIFAEIFPNLLTFMGVSPLISGRYF